MNAAERLNKFPPFRQHLPPVGGFRRVRPLTWGGTLARIRPHYNAQKGCATSWSAVQLPMESVERHRVRSGRSTSERVNVQPLARERHMPSTSSGLLEGDLSELVFYTPLPGPVEQGLTWSPSR